MTKQRQRERKQKRKVQVNNKESRNVKRDLLALEQNVVNALNKPQQFNQMLSNDELISCGNKEQILAQAKLLDQDIRRLAARLDPVREKINASNSFVTPEEKQAALMLAFELEQILQDFAQTADNTAFALGGLLDEAKTKYLELKKTDKEPGNE